MFIEQTEKEERVSGLESLLKIVFRFFFNSLSLGGWRCNLVGEDAKGVFMA